MHIAFFIAGCCAVVAGLIQICFKNVAWKSTQWINKTKGVRSEASSAWRVASIIEGAIGVAVGIGLILLVISSNGARSDGIEQSAMRGQYVVKR